MNGSTMSWSGFARPMTWWLTGLPAAGKTTLAKALTERLRVQGQSACLLDGDELRTGVCAGLDFSPEGRAENMRRTAEMASLLNREGIHAVVALVSPTHSGRAQARQRIGDAQFIEVFLSTPLAVCEARDFKGLYEKARREPAFPLTGFNAPYEIPAFPEIVIDCSMTEIATAVDQVMRVAGKKTELIND